MGFLVVICSSDVSSNINSNCLGFRLKTLNCSLYSLDVKTPTPNLPGTTKLEPPEKLITSLVANKRILLPFMFDAFAIFASTMIGCNVDMLILVSPKKRSPVLTCISPPITTSLFIRISSSKIVALLNIALLTSK